MSKKVVIAVPGQHKWPKLDQDYKHFIAKLQFKEPNFSAFFNSILHGDNFDIYGFLQPGVRFYNKSSLSKIVEVFNIPNIGAVYCDSKHQFHPPFSIKNKPLNTSLFINGIIRQHLKFNETENLLEDVFIQLMRNHLLIVHLPECIFE